MPSFDRFNVSLYDRGHFLFWNVRRHDSGGHTGALRRVVSALASPRRHEPLTSPLRKRLRTLTKFPRPCFIRAPCVSAKSIRHEDGRAACTEASRLTALLNQAVRDGGGFLFSPSVRDSSPGGRRRHLSVRLEMSGYRWDGWTE